MKLSITNEYNESFIVVVDTISSPNEVATLIKGYESTGCFVLPDYEGNMELKQKVKECL